ncbi:VrrA/YqfQ family protein [Virgibacillus siamensis]|uniref:VrrA/YqfQ family protein n=1 Tax=Virgibacillus siamensis TaxID=480071 RepID=UPI0009858A10|nr:VrrA/YqfQ family protein [Virgibacillus siamensis]
MVWPIHTPDRTTYIRDIPNSAPPHRMNRILPVQQVQNLLTPERVGTITNTLTKVQHVLKAVENAAPIVQQYAPMVRNLPMMFQIMKALKETDGIEGTDSLDDDYVDEDPDNDDFIEAEHKLSGNSSPKLFI